MSRPATRLLGFLELLQGAPSLSGADAAQRLGVDRRTIRRYVEALQDLGIPVEGQRGAGGGYRLRPGYRLPPLMLGDAEATAVVVGLVATQRLGLPGAEPALAKVGRVLPPVLRRRAEALAATLAFLDVNAVPEAPPGDTLLVLADAARRHRRVRVRYTPADGASQTRELDPHGVVVSGGRWYVSARDATSGALRTFRVDRLDQAVLGEVTGAPPMGFDAAAEVARSLAGVPWRWRVEALVDAPHHVVADHIPPMLAELTARGDRTLLVLRADSLAWAASVLAGLGQPFVVHGPDELRPHLRALAATLEASAASARR
jgi:predicted DNA-binding transcriptional regulator YafY